MGRRRQGLASDLMVLPWQVSAVLAVLSFAALRWLLPVILPPSPLIAGLAPVLAPLSWIALCTFGTLAVLSGGRQKLGKGIKPRRSRKSKARHAVPVATPTPAIKVVAMASPSPPAEWSLEALRSLEWKRFELLCARYYEAVGFQSVTLAAGADGGIDVKLYKIDPAQAIAIVQCKAWNTRPVGVKEIRELLGVMAHEKVGRGIFMSTGSYTVDASAFGAANPIQLLDGPAFLAKLRDLTPEQQAELLAFAFAGDYRTPTCASCGVKLIVRESRRGAFWGCMHYPRCKTTMPMRPEAVAA